jgi:hypothetical protein
VANGTYRQAAGRVRRYRCFPLTGVPHTFGVGIEGGRRLHGQQGAPSCPHHPRSHVTRHGSYGGPNGAPRQRYRCDHARCSSACRPECPGFHTFTPPLPRHHVKLGDQCDDCLELRGIHRGEMVVARRHRWPARVVADRLAEMAGGTSYVRAGRNALQAVGVPTSQVRRRSVTPVATMHPDSPPATDAPAEPEAKDAKARAEAGEKKKRRVSAASRQAHRFWQIGAGFVEAFAPIVWAKTDERLRARTAAMREAGQRIVWLLDEIPIYARERGGKRKKTDGYGILVLTEIDWTDTTTPDGTLSLRLVRAMPKITSIAWRLLFDELGVVPDMIVSDASTAIVAAHERHFADPRPLFVPSLWHLGQALQKNALAAAVRGPTRDAFRAHLALLARDSPVLASPEAWHRWWDGLMALAQASDAVQLDNLLTSRENYEGRMARALPTLNADPRLRLSTGGLEGKIRDAIERVLRNREHVFGNIERTNNLMDLVVCQEAGDLLDRNAVARLIEADERPHGGWTVPLRTIADPRPRVGRYRSLRDEAQMVAVASERGIW